MAENAPETPPPADAGQLTSYHVRRAAAGEGGSVEWLISRLSPLLLAQAELRLGAELRRHYDPEDLVHEAWLVALPRIGSLTPRDGRHTPVLLKFLGTTLLYRIRNLVRKHVDGAPPVQQQADSVAADQSGAITGLVRREARDEVWRCLNSLRAEDREILILRGVEQHTNATVGMLLGISAEAASKRYQRALQSVREQLPRSVFDEL